MAVTLTLGFMLLGADAQAAYSWTALLNGTTGDATAVMGIFDCLATAPSLIRPDSIAPSAFCQLTSIKLQRGTLASQGAQ